MSPPPRSRHPHHKSTKSQQSSIVRGAHGKIITLTPDKVLEFTCTTQKKAAKRLGCSLSTLKRRFHSIGGKWPYASMPEHEKKQYIYYCLNYHDHDEKQISEDTMSALKEAMKVNKGPHNSRLSPSCSPSKSPDRSLSHMSVNSTTTPVSHLPSSFSSVAPSSLNSTNQHREPQLIGTTQSPNHPQHGFPRG
mmetsp:Transcript_2039/g.7312  ORF Transcript_2039/g.7312 Transcript_2039/m.7312 type:complete len:192 (+) Transcript_2039:127-702(+)